MKPLEIDDARLQAALDALEGHGYIQQSKKVGGAPLSTGIHLMPPGRAEIRERHQRREPSVRRDTACRDGLLDWIDAQRRSEMEFPVLSKFFLDPRSYYEGEQYTESEVNAASRYLREKGLIKGTAAFGAGVLRPALTADGLDVIEHYEGSTSAYLRPQPAAQGATVHYTQTFHRDVHGQVAQGETVSQTQNAGLDVQELLALMQSIRAAAQEVPDEDAAPVLQVVQQVEEGARESDADTDWIRSLLNRLGRISGKVGNVALATAVATATNQALTLL